MIKQKQIEQLSTALVGYMDDQLQGSFFAWADTGNSGGDATSIVQSAEPGACGIAREGTGTSATGWSNLRTQIISTVLSGCAWTFTIRFRIAPVPTAAQNATITIGVAGNADGNIPTNGVYLQVNNAGASYVCKSGGTASSIAVPTGQLTAATWYTLVISTNKAATQANFSLNGASAGSIFSNLPATALLGLLCQVASTAGTTAKLLDIDYIKMAWDFR